MNLQNLMSQLGKSSNPMAMLMSMLTGNQQNTVNQFQNKSKEEQAEEIAKICNEKGIDKQQLQSILNMLNKG